MGNTPGRNSSGTERVIDEQFEQELAAKIEEFFRRVDVDDDGTINMDDLSKSSVKG